MTKIELFNEEKLVKMVMKYLFFARTTWGVWYSPVRKKLRFGWWRNSVFRYKCLGFGRFCQVFAAASNLKTVWRKPLLDWQKTSQIWGVLISNFLEEKHWPFWAEMVEVCWTLLLTPCLVVFSYWSCSTKRIIYSCLKIAYLSLF